MLEFDVIAQRNDEDAFTLLWGPVVRCVQDFAVHAIPEVQKALSHHCKRPTAIVSFKISDILQKHNARLVVLRNTNNLEKERAAGIFEAQLTASD